MSVIAPGRNIVLIGLMGAGKTTVGKLLAARLGRPFVDTDDVVSNDARSTVAELFSTHGERYFRSLESSAVRQVAALRGQVIAAGGGAVLDPSNVTHLRATGDIVLLDADPSLLADRVGNSSGRPLVDGTDVAQRLEQLRTQRAAAYAGAALHVVDTTDRSPEEVADAVFAWAVRQPGLLSRDEVDR